MNYWIFETVLLSLMLTVYSLDKVPSIHEPDKRRREVLTDTTTFTLNCEANGNPQPTYDWLFNGGNTTQSMNVNRTSGQLKIATFTEREIGNYQCLAENEIRGQRVVAMSPIIRLDKARLDTTWNDKETAIKANKGVYTRITCDNPPISIPAGSYSWYYSAQGDIGKLEEGDRIHIDKEGTLHFINVTTSDTRSYQCAIFNKALDLFKLSSPKNLTVLDKQSAEKEVTLQFHTKQAKFHLTKDAELECVFSGVPVPKTTWLDNNGNEISMNENKKYLISNSGRRLIIKSLIEDDEGNYTCIDKHNKTNGTIFLDVISSPIWVEPLVTQIVPEGRDAVFKCKARPAVGDGPLSPPTWLKNGKALDIKMNSRFMLSEGNSVLTVKNLNKSTDVMCFQCNISNDIGYEFKDGCLKVIKPIVVHIKPIGTQKIREGGIINLTVIGEGDPDYPLQLRWHFKNETFFPDSSNNIVFNEKTQEAYINTSTLNDEEYQHSNGTYRIELYNHHDSVTISTTVILDPVTEIIITPVVTAGGGLPYLWWIAVIIAGFICILIIIIIIVICKRTKRKKKHSIQPVDKDYLKINGNQPEELESRLSIEPESLDSETNEPMKIWLEDDEFDDDIDLRDFDEDGSFIGNSELSRLSLNHI